MNYNLLRETDNPNVKFGLVYVYVNVCI